MEENKSRACSLYGNIGPGFLRLLFAKFSHQLTWHTFDSYEDSVLCTEEFFLTNSAAGVENQQNKVLN